MPKAYRAVQSDGQEKEDQVEVETEHPSVVQGQTSAEQEVLLMAETSTKHEMEEEAEEKKKKRKGEGEGKGTSKRKHLGAHWRADEYYLLHRLSMLNLRDSTETERRAKKSRRRAKKSRRKGSNRHSVDVIMENVKEKLKAHLREKFTCIYEGTGGDRSRLQKVYTELYITQDIGKYDYKSHENLHGFNLWNQRIDCLGIFMESYFFKFKHGGSGKKVMTKGIAGIGKTVAVQNFALHWAEGNFNQHIDFIFVLPFRELNLLKEGEYSLLQLLLHFYPELKQIDAQKLLNKKVLFIFDGLDESRFPLDFAASKTVSDIDQRSTVDVLLTNLIKGKLLPNTLLWITSRPAAASQIPPEYIDQMTEVHGFTDQQKEEYFRKRFSDADQAKEVISYIRGMISFSFMSHIPIFCWITAEVFKKGEIKQKSRIIITMTELYIHYLLIQTQRATHKYGETKPGEMDQKEILESENVAMLLKLAQLAFEQLEEGNILFYEEDLRQCGIDVDKASLFYGLCSKVLKQEYGLYQKKMFSFVHLSFQEFLAAVYMFHCCVTKKLSALKSFLGDEAADLPLHELLKRVVDKAIQSETGHLDLFLCFFLGISLETNQTLLQGLLPQTQTSSETVEEMKRHLRKFHGGNISHERCMNLFLCKYELKEQRVQNEIQAFLQSGVKLSPFDCSVLSTMLLMSEEVIDEIDLTKCYTPFEDSDKLLLPLKNCRKAAVKSDIFKYESLQILVSILQSKDSSLRELHLECCSSHNNPVPGYLFAVLINPHCKLETLRLSGFALRREEYEALTSVLQSTQSTLRALDFTYCTYVQPYASSSHHYKTLGEDEELHICDNSLVTIIPAVLSPVCKVEKFRMSGCHLKSRHCEVFGSVLSSNPILRELDLSHNNLQDSGVKLLSVGLASPTCRLESLRLSGCGITEVGCASLASALSSNPSHLRELDLSFNHPGDSGVKLLSERLEDHKCRLEKLNVEHDEDHWVNPQQLKKYACKLTLDPNTANSNLLLSEGNRRVKYVEEKQPYPDHPKRFDIEHQVLCREGLTGRCYWEVEWTGLVPIGVTYKTINRKGGRDVKIGQNEKSWSFNCHLQDAYYFQHKHQETFVPLRIPDTNTFWDRFKRPMVWSLNQPKPKPRRLGVYLDWPAGILSFYLFYSDTMTLLHTFHTSFTEPLYPAFSVYGGSLTLSNVLQLNMDSIQTCFTPEITTKSANTLYRFKFPGAGVFQCSLTRLVFGVTGEGEVLYRTVQWDESLLYSAGRTPAGPLFNIQCPQRSVNQLHLPHCETNPVLLSGSLSVVHITDDGMSILEPQKITETHVVINVSHFSAFGLIWDYIKRFLNLNVSIKSQVLLFLGPPNTKQRRKMNVLLLPRNVPVQEVRGQQENDQYIKTTSYCRLRKDQTYSLLSNPEGYEIQPESAPFDLNYGPNYHPTFEVVLTTSTEDVTLMVQDQEKTKVWRRRVDLAGPGPSGENPTRTQSLSAEDRLRSVRTEFIQRVTEPVLDKLLDELLGQMFINDEEMESARTRTRRKKAEEVIDMVRRKGSDASSKMIDIFRKLDPHLSKELQLS
ncbi:NACHT, LRR and PYD domains-containing protein 3-like isoform 1-T1 [Polymixia lowei]